MFPKSWLQHQLQGRLAISHLYWICTLCSQELSQSMSVYMHPSVLMLPFNSPRQRQWVCTDSSHYSHTSDEKSCSSSSLFTEKHVWDFVCGTSEWVSLSVRGSRLQHSSYQLSPHQRNSSQLLIWCQNSLRLRPFAQHVASTLGGKINTTSENIANKLSL